MLGLERGMVKLVPHQKTWDENAKDTIVLLKTTAADIQHVGSTAIRSIHAKPIIDIAVGVQTLEAVMPFCEKLERYDVIFRGQDMAEQLLFVMGDLEKNTRTHHIHVVKWKGIAWNNYLNFRDYLNAFLKKAQIYDNFKQKLALQFPDNRKDYTDGKQTLISILLKEALDWKMRN